MGPELISTVMRPFLLGALCMGCLLIGLYFLRSWRSTHDPLFAWFSIGFWAMSLNWLGLALIPVGSEGRHILYLLRLVAFVLIIAGIVGKNRRGGHA